MDYFCIVLSNIIFIIFPMLLYYVAVAHKKIVDKKDNELLLEFFLYTSLYLILKLGNGFVLAKPLYLINIPVLFAYFKKRYKVAILMSLTLIYYLYTELSINLIYLIIEYTLCLILYLVIKNKWYFSISFLIVKIIFISQYITNIKLNLIMIGTFIITSYLIVYLISYVENEMKFYNTLKDIENDKQIHKSLFKIAHEVKNPIAVIKGYLSLMDGSIEKYEKYTPFIKEAVNHSLSILEDFSNIGKLNVNLDIIDINYLLEEVTSIYKPILSTDNIELNFDEIDDEIFVNGDYKKLKEVFINIIKNSKEANSKKIDITTEIKDNKIIIKCSDDGDGISNDDLIKITEPFFTTKQNGTGLGVYLSKEIIMAHNGEMLYESYGKGTNVYIKLDLFDLV